MAAPSGAVLGAAALLERSITYMLGNLVLVTPAMLDRPTPCATWDVRTLLEHIEDGLTALVEAVSVGRIETAAPVALVAVRRADTEVDHDGVGTIEVGLHQEPDPIEGVRAAARTVIEGWSTPVIAGSIDIDGLPLSSALVAAAGGIEIAAHGWDIARAAGWRRPVPTSLADEMLDLLPLLLTDATRGYRYGNAVPVPPFTCAGDRLIALLGRRPPDPVERRYLQSRAALLLTASS
ncbi:MAG TPA: maleylpyruvate isomerase N-terminal domain-containing protein [Micromonosporaceae bacterium]